MGKYAVVLSSGGVDSTTCVGLAVKKYGFRNVTTLSLFYGQKHDKELMCAKQVAEYYHVPHIEKDISTVMEFSNCSLLTHSTDEIKHTDYGEQVAENESGRVNTYVPFRNGLLLSIAASIADSLYPGEEVDIYYGAHADDSAGSAYADCSPEFVRAIGKAITQGTYGKIKVVAPLIKMNKTQVVAKGISLKVPYKHTWSCYEGGELACGTCGTCRDRLKAFADNGVGDPIKYVEGVV